MSARGGRVREGGLSGSHAAKRSRTVPLLFAFLLLAPALLIGVPPAEAQRSSDPWWGPSDRTQPTAGFAIRIPVTVENDQTYTLRQQPVAVELDFTKLLIEAGWTSKAVLAERALQGFTLDVDSIRVVEYGRGFASGPVGEGTPVPHVFYKSLLSAERTRDFDPTNNPAGTVMFVVDHIAPSAKKFYYVYANPVQFGDRDPAEHEPLKMAPLDGLLWSTAGTVFYGYQPQQRNDNHRIHVMNTAGAPATVTLYQFSGGGPVPVPTTTRFPNPVMLQPGASLVTQLPVNTGAPFKVVSDQPVRVAMHGQQNPVGVSNYPSAVEANVFVPGDHNSFVDDSFTVYGFVVGTNGNSQVTVMRANNVGSVNVHTASGMSQTLTGADPVAQISVNGAWDSISADGPILVTHTTTTSREFLGHPVPSRTGGPSGTQFYAYVPGDGGFSVLCPESDTTLRIVDLTERNRQLFPSGNRQTTAAALLPGGECHVEKGAAAYSTTDPVDVFATVEATDPVADKPVPLRVLAGAGERSGTRAERPFIGPFAGLHGNDYVTVGATGLFGHYPGTKVTIVEQMARGPDRTEIRSLAEDTFFVVRPSEGSTGRFHITANKPFTAVSVADAEFYGAYLGGRPLQVPVEVGPAEFRGPLVALRFLDSDATEQTKDTGPESPVKFQVEVANLGRWIGGAGLSDTIRLDCPEVPDGWVIEGCDQDLRLDSGVSERIVLSVTPPADDVNVTRTIPVTATSTTAGITALLKLRVRVSIVYGLDMRFHTDSGPRTIDPPVGVDPGETHTYDVFVKNTGSSRDRFTFEVDPPREGWTQSLLREGQRVDSVTLDAGEVAVLQFVVTAPNAETAPQNLVSIKGQSVSSLNANAVVNSATRIRPNVDVRLTLDPPTQVAEPNQTAVFNLTLLNSGNDIFRILLREDSVLPEGWTSRLEVTEIDLGPGQPFRFALEVTPPPGARAGDLATAKITAETDLGDGGATIPGDEVGAVVVVRRIHNITTPALPDVETESGVDLTYVLPVTNSGNGDDTIEVLPSASSPPWRVVSQVPSLTLGRDESGDLPLVIEVPGNATPGLVNLTFTLRLSRESTQNITLPLVIQETARVRFDGLRDLDVLPGQPRLLTTTVVNTGNMRAEFDLATQAPEEWNVTFEPSRLTLEPGASQRVTVRVNASRDAADGAYALDLKPDAASGVSGTGSVAASLARPDLFVENVQTTGRPRAGDLVLVTATIGNRGDAAAENVTVALVVDDVIVHRVELGRVPVGQRSVATLSWLATATPGQVSVVIDPENAMVETTSDDNVAQVEFASRVPMPGPLALLAVAGAAALALRRWRA